VENELRNSNKDPESRIAASLNILADL
jgi:hypothetical protein